MKIVNRKRLYEWLVGILSLKTRREREYAKLLSYGFLDNIDLNLSSTATNIPAYAYNVTGDSTLIPTTAFIENDIERFDISNTTDSSIRITLDASDSIIGENSASFVLYGYENMTLRIYGAGQYMVV